MTGPIDQHNAEVEALLAKIEMILDGERQLTAYIAIVLTASVMTDEMIDENTPDGVGELKRVLDNLLPELVGGSIAAAVEERSQNN